MKTMLNSILGTGNAAGRTCATGRAMSRLARLFVLPLSLLGLGAWGGNSDAATCTSTATGGNWDAQTTWGAAGTGCVGALLGIPGAADNVIIATTGAGAVTVNVQAAMTNLTVNSGGTLTIQGGSNFRIRPTGTTSISGTLNFGTTTSSSRFTGLVTVTSTGTWNNSGNQAINFRGGLTNNGGTFTAGTGVYTFGTNAQAIGGTSPITIPNVTVTTIALTNNGTLTASATLAGSGSLVNSATGTLNIGGTSAITTLTATAAGNTVNYTGAAQTVKATAYSNLGLSGSGIKTLTGVTTVGGNLTMSGTATATTAAALAIGGNLDVGAGTTLTVGGFNIGVAGTTSVSGTLVHSNAAGTKTFTGAVTINLGGSWTNPGNEAITYAGGLVNNGSFASGTVAQTFTNGGITHNGTAFTAGTGVFTFSTNPQAINCATALTIPSITTAIALTNNCNLTVTTALAGAGNFINAANSQLHYNSTTAIGVTTLTASATGNLVDYGAAGNQTVDIPAASTYYHLTLSGSGAKTMTGVTTIGGDLAITGSATMTSNAAFTVTGALNYSSTGSTTLTAGNNISIGSFNQTAGTFAAGANTITVSGNWNETGTFTSTGTVTLNGAAAQTISGTSPVTFNNLTVTNTTSPYNITLSATNVTVATLTGTVTLTPGCPDYTLTSTTPAQVLHSCTMVSSINRMDADPTSAATVRWQVIFSRSVTGVGATAFSLVPTGLSGAYITTVTGSGTTWTVTANTGIGSGTLGLNQTGPGSVVPPLNGTFTGQVYTISATPALAEYSMDESFWNGTANEVMDSSGNGNNAQSFNSANTVGTTPAIAANPGTCNYGVFDNGTITQGYVQTPLPDLTTDFTVTAWIRTTNNTVQGQRILIDDQNNSGGYGISLGDGGTGIIRFYSRGITPIILDSAYAIASNAWYFVAAVADTTNKKRTIYVFDATGALLNSTTEAAWTSGAWGVDPGPVSIGAETNASGESPATYHFRGNLDEVRVYQKVLSQSALAAIATQTHTCPINVPHHLVVQSPGSGLTCAASTLTVVACQDLVCTPYTGGVSGTLAASGPPPTVNWDGTTGGATGAGFVIPAGSASVTKNVQVATAGTVTFGISSATPAPANGTICNFGNNAPANDNCVFTANTAGFLFSDTSTPGTSYTIPAQVSGIATPSLYLRAVQAATANPAVCTPAIIGKTVAVNMGYTCNNPATCQAGSLATITNTTTGTATAIAPAGTSVSLDFDANGSAPITARYDDVGQITFNANATVTPFSGATAVALNGSSNAIIVAPHHFGFSGITAGPIKAGNNFAATVTAYNGLATPTATTNFGNETSPQGATLTFTKCQPTGTNSSNGAFSGSATFTNGVAIATNLNWGEVGNGDLVATNSNYLASGLNATGNTGTGGTACNGALGAGNVGRFIPDHFDTVVTGPMTCPSGLTCPAGGMAYSGQAFTTNVYARNATGGTTQNYDGTANTAPNFAQSVTLYAWDGLGSTTTQNPPAATPGSIGSNTIAVTSFARGTTVSPGIPGAPIYTFGTTPTNPTDIYLRAVDADGVTSLRVPANTSVEGGLKVVNGRIKVSNAYGSELLPLTLIATAQYYSATGWANSITDVVTNLTLAANYNLLDKNGNTTGTTAASKSPASGLSAGKLTITLAKPSGGASGTATIAPTAPGYLPVIPGTATFGVYKGNNSYIYRRESY